LIFVPARSRYTAMNTQLVTAAAVKPPLEFDLIADFACPWSFLGKRKLERALDNLYAASAPALRWHGLRAKSGVPAASSAWRDHLVTRLPVGVSVDLAQDTLSQAGRELGINFDFERLRGLPDTREAHRLVKLAEGDGLEGVLVDALFSAFFERGLDIGDHNVLEQLARERGLNDATLAAFNDPAAGGAQVDAEEKRLHGLGVNGTPNLLINGRILVPGPADVSTYVHALDQALFPGLTVSEDEKRLLH
jgi:predicted DsbA family dithiol-disulfide isomerase